MDSTIVDSLGVVTNGGTDWDMIFNIINVVILVLMAVVGPGLMIVWRKVKEWADVIYVLIKAYADDGQMSDAELDEFLKELEEARNSSNFKAMVLLISKVQLLKAGELSTAKSRKK